MNDDSLAEASIAASTWRELTADPAPDLLTQLAEAAHRHNVMVSIHFSPYDSAQDAE